MIAVLSVFLASNFSTQAPDGEFRVGRIVIEGNTDTPDRVILAQLRVFPGQKAKGLALRQAEQRLRALGIFKANPWRGTGPTVTSIPNEIDNEFHDVLVRVRERPGNWLAFGIVDVVLAREARDVEAFVAGVTFLVRRTIEAAGMGP